MLEIRIRVLQNPWNNTVPDEDLVEIITAVARTRTEHVKKQFLTGEYKRNCLGLAILDPSAPLWRPSQETLLATIAIGKEGARFVPNAIAKAIEHRDKGQPGGYGVYVDLTQSKDGDFCYGFSTQVDGTIAAASAQSEIQDACEAGHAAVTFNYYIRKFRQEWRESPSNKNIRWFDNLDHPSGIYSTLAEGPAHVRELTFDAG